MGKSLLNAVKELISLVIALPLLIGGFLFFGAVGIWETFDKHVLNWFRRLFGRPEVIYEDSKKHYRSYGL